MTVSHNLICRYQSTLILPVVEETWDEHVKEVHARLQGQNSLLVSGDGRCDSPGSCAKYCMYTLMESSTKQIVHSQTVTRDMVSFYIFVLYGTHPISFMCPCAFIQAHFLYKWNYRWITSHLTWKKKLYAALCGVPTREDQHHWTRDGCLNIHYFYDG